MKVSSSAVFREEYENDRLILYFVRMPQIYIQTLQLTLYH